VSLGAFLDVYLKIHVLACCRYGPTESVPAHSVSAVRQRCPRHDKQPSLV
jgi:hypothetical protein